MLGDSILVALDYLVRQVLIAGGDYFKVVLVHPVEENRYRNIVTLYVKSKS